MVVRRKGKLTGGTHLSVTLGSERARERGSGPAGLAGPRCSRPARLVGVCDSGHRSGFWAGEGKRLEGRLG